MRIPKQAGVGLVLSAGVLVGAGLGLLILIFLGKAPGFPALRFTIFQEPGPRVGSAAPDFELVDLKGDRIRLSELRGKPVLVNFWATWCAPCKLEMPDIQKIYESYPGEFVVLAVNAGENAAQVEKFSNDIGVSFDVLLDPKSEVQDLYQLRGYPTSYLVDGEGVIRVQHVGLLNESQLVDYLAQVGVAK